MASRFFFFFFVIILCCSAVKGLLRFDEVGMPAGIEAPLLLQLPSSYLRRRSTPIERKHVKLPSETDISLFHNLSASQNGEDKHYFETVLSKNLSSVHGVYLELGALNGKRYSNTFALEHAFGWTGVLIEPGPVNFNELIKNRPKNILLNLAVCSSPKEVHFVENGAVGGVYEFMSPEFKAKWWPDLETTTKLPAEKTPCLPLSSIMRVLDIHHIDFFSVDVEGGELEVLKTFDFDSVRVSCLIVEADGSNSAKEAEIQDLLKLNGFKHEGRTLNSDWFVRGK